MFKQVKARVLACRALNSPYKRKHLKHASFWKKKWYVRNVFGKMCNVYLIIMSASNDQKQYEIFALSCKKLLRRHRRFE